MGKKSVVVSKQDILEALAKEPLIGETWVDPDRIYEGRWGLKETTDSCRVCAVGAVLRGIGLANDEIDKSAKSYTQDDFVLPYAEDYDRKEVERIAQDKLKEGNPLGALSCIFEWAFQMGNERGDAEREGRCTAMKFVRDHFPDKLRLTTAKHRSPYRAYAVKSEKKS